MPHDATAHHPHPATPWRPRAFLDLLKRTLVAGTRGEAPKEAALLAYTILFALGPLLVLAVSVASLFFGPDAPRDALVRDSTDLMGEKGGQVFGDLLHGGTETSLGILGTLLGSLSLLLFAGLAFAQLKWSLNRIWSVKPRAHHGWKDWCVAALRRNLGSLAGALGAAFLLMVSFLGTLLISVAGARLAAWLPDALHLGAILPLLLGILVTWLVFAALFKLLPDAEVSWRDVTIGAAATTLLFFAGQLILSTYLANGPLGTAYGAAGGIMLLLVWVYYSSLIVLYGAQFTQVYANLYGSCVHPSEGARAEADAEHDDEKRPAKKGTATK